MTFCRSTFSPFSYVRSTEHGTLLAVIKVGGGLIRHVFSPRSRGDVLWLLFVSWRLSTWLKTCVQSLFYYFLASHTSILRESLVSLINLGFPYDPVGSPESNTKVENISGTFLPVCLFVSLYLYSYEIWPSPFGKHRFSRCRNFLRNFWLERNGFNGHWIFNLMLKHKGRFKAFFRLLKNCWLYWPNPN